MSVGYGGHILLPFMVVWVRFVVQIPSVVELDGVAGLRVVFAIAHPEGLFFEAHYILCLFLFLDCGITVRRV
jgi:hypothetical protein